MTKKIVISWLVTLGIVILMAAGFYPVMNKYSQSFRFADEEEHLVIGWLMNRGFKLYRDISTNHQPINYIATQIFQKIVPIDNSYMLIKRHRQLLFLYAVGWWFILIKVFGKKMIVPLVIFESIKYLFLGNEFVAESLANYPVAFLLASLFKLTLKPKTTKIADFSWGVLSVWIPLTLLPLAVPVGLINLGRLIILKSKSLKWWLIGITAGIVVVCLWIHPMDYFRETISNNYLYALPGLTPIKTKLDYVRMMGLPFLYVPYYRDILGQVVILITIAWLLSMAIFLLQKKWTKAASTIFLFGLWCLTNLRIVAANKYFYEAFHLTPWFLVGLVGGTLVMSEALKVLKPRPSLMITGGLMLGVLVVMTNKNLPLFTKINPETEHYIQFTPITQAAEVINSIKQTGDTLMVIPNDSLIYYLTQIYPHPSQLVTVYDWQILVPRNRELFYSNLKTNPPTFFVYRDDRSSYDPLVNELVKFSYRQLMDAPGVFIRNDRLAQLTPDEITRYHQLPLSPDQLHQLP